MSPSSKRRILLAERESHSNFDYLTLRCWNSEVARGFRYQGLKFVYAPNGERQNSLYISELLCASKRYAPNNAKIRYPGCSCELCCLALLVTSFFSGLVIIQFFMYFLQELSFFLLLLLIGRSNSSSKTELDAAGI